MGFIISRARRRTLACCLSAAWLVCMAGCGPVNVQASGSNDHVDWSVGLPF